MTVKYTAKLIFNDFISVSLSKQTKKTDISISPRVAKHILSIDGAHITYSQWRGHRRLLNYLNGDIAETSIVFICSYKYNLTHSPHTNPKPTRKLLAFLQ